MTVVISHVTVYARAEEAQGETMWAAMARHLDATSPDARVLCCSGEGKRSEAAWRTVQQLRSRRRRSSSGDAAGLRCVAREEVGARRRRARRAGSCCCWRRCTKYPSRNFVYPCKPPHAKAIHTHSLEHHGEG